MHFFRVEMLVASWSEHLLQHERITKEEQSNIEKAWSLDIRPDGPAVKHYISVNKELLGGKQARSLCAAACRTRTSDPARGCERRTRGLSR